VRNCDRELPLGAKDVSFEPHVATGSRNGMAVAKRTILVWMVSGLSQILDL